MTIETAVELAREATLLTLLLSLPLMSVAVVVGLFISIAQAVTQIQEQTISFVPKLVIMMVTLLLILPWSLGRLVEYSTVLIRDIPSRF